MKKSIVIALGAIVTLGSTLALAESEVKKSIILNQSQNKGNAAVAIGEGNTANVGSIGIKDSKVDKSIILNQSQNKGNAAIAIGKENAANVGSIDIK